MGFEEVFFDEKPNILRFDTLMAKIHDLGRRGEELAVNYLINRGFHILKRNFRYRKAEIDIIAHKDGILAMVEVKTRNDGFYEGISDSISRKKRKLLVMAADHYVLSNSLDIEVRFDIITLIKGQEGYTIEHIPDAFYHF